MTSEDFKSFYSFARPFGYTGGEYAKNLPLLVRLWLATERSRQRFAIDSSPPHQVLETMEGINTTIRRSWAQKAAATRANNAKRNRKRAKAKADPTPFHDSRIGSLF